MPRPVEEAAVQQQGQHHPTNYQNPTNHHNINGQHYQQQHAHACDYPPQQQQQQQQQGIYNGQSLSNLADVAVAEATDNEYAATAMADDPLQNHERRDQDEVYHTEAQLPQHSYPHREHNYYQRYPAHHYPQHYQYPPHQQYDGHRQHYTNHERPYHYPQPHEQLQCPPPQQQYKNINIPIQRTSTQDAEMQEVIVEAVEYAQRAEKVDGNDGKKRSSSSSSSYKNRKVKRVKRGYDPNQVGGKDQEGHDEGNYEQHVDRRERPHHAQAWHNHHHPKQQYYEYQQPHPQPWTEQRRPPHEHYHRPPNETGGHPPHHPPPHNGQTDQYYHHLPQKTVAAPRIPPIQQATPVHPDTSPNPHPTYAQEKHQHQPREHEVPPPSIHHYHTQQQHRYPPPQMPPPQPQQTNIFPPMFTHRISEKKSQAQSLKKNKTKTTVPIDVSQMHKLNPTLLPIYKYSTTHQSKSWNEMIQIFNDFVDREGHGDVEKDDPSLKEGYTSGTDTEDDPDLLLRSWIREVRWVVRAEGLGQNRDPQRMVVGATKAAAKKSSDKSSPSGDRAERNQKASLEPRCDSENVTEERYEQLSSIEHFPLIKKYTESSSSKSIVSHISSFQLWLDDLQHYRAKHDGDCNVPQKYAEFPALGHFVNRQRSAYKKLKEGKSSAMTAIKIQQLDTVNFVWSTTQKGGNASWEDRFNELKDYLHHHGHTNVPKKHPPNPPLGFWVNEQRFQHRKMMKGKSSYMTEYRANLLNSLNFKWELKESPKTWDESIEELRQYKATYGHVNVETDDKYSSLVSFVNNQRDDYRRYVNGNKTIKYMTEDRIKVLQDLGISWNLGGSKSGWSDRFEEMKEYKRQFGNCDITVNLKYSKNKPLSSWVSRQRHQYKLYKQGEQSTLTEEHIQELNDIGFNWRYNADNESNKKKGKLSKG